MTSYGAVGLACLILSVAGQSQIQDPCRDSNCVQPGYECRLVQVICTDGDECPAQPMCLPRQESTGRCSYGLEVLQQVGDQVYSPLDCTFQMCPASSECRYDPNQSVCCWTPFKATTLPTPSPPFTAPPAIPVLGNLVPRHCAKTFPLPFFFCRLMVPQCETDSDCLQGSKCCYTDRCGRKGCLLARFQEECSFIDRIMGLCD